MKRRDFVRGAGTLILGGTALKSSGLSSPGSATTAAPAEARDLVVTFAGPFCYWQESGKIKVMAPPVGPNFHAYPHQPWFGTTTNEIAVDTQRGTDFELKLGDYTPPTKTDRSGTNLFPYEQGQGTGAKPLFTLYVPAPKVIIGMWPTVVKMVCTPGTPDPICTDYTVLASGTTFLYENVAPEKVKFIFADTGKDFFTPCFTNDAALPANGLGVHLTPLHRPDPGHLHAKEVWGQMIAMYPWMKKEITGIDFCPNFDTAVCNFDPKLCSLNAKPHRIMVGPGGDCQVPIMDLGTGPSYQRKKR